MWFRFRAVLLPFAVVLISSIASYAGDQGKVARVDFVVVRSFNGKPVRNASVVLHPVNKDGKASKGGVELKTDPEGKASMDSIPYGKLRVQALAPGLQTYGNDIEVTEPVQEITIKMNRPQEQYSIYK
jgi:hypothetical protein